MANFFDQFDEAPVVEKSATNFFDQFDELPKQKIEEPKTETAKPEPIKPKLEPEEEKFSTLRHVADIPLKSTTGLITGIKMLSDAFGANNLVSRNLSGAEHYVADLMSAQAKEDSARVQEILKEAQDKGLYDQLVSGIKAFSVAPVGMVANALGTAAPAIIAALGAEVLGPAAFLTSAGIGITTSAGAIKGSIYDAVKEELSKTNMPADQIEARAQLAQNYNGENLDMILMGAAFGAIGATSGVEASIARQVAKNIVSKTAKEEVAAVAKEKAAKIAEKQIQEAAKRGAVRQAARTGAIEFGTEFGQAVQENMAQNLALQREGYDVPLTRGVFGEALTEGLAGLGMGAPVGFHEASRAKDLLEKRELAKDLLDQYQKQQDANDKANATNNIPAGPEQSTDEILASAANAPKTVTPTATIDQDTQSVLDKLQQDYDNRKKQIDDGTHPNVKAATITNEKTQTAIDAIKSGTPINEAIKNLSKKQKDLLATVTIGPANVTPTPPTTTPAPTVSTSESLQAANDYITKIDAGQKIKQSEYRPIAKALGLNIPVGTTNINGIQMIKDHLAKQQGEQNVGDNTVAGTDTTSTQVSQQQGVGTTTEGTTGTIPGGVAGTDTTQGQPGTGEEAQRDTLTPEQTTETTPDKKQQAINDFQSAGADLLDILNTKVGNKLNFTPEEEKLLMPTLIKLFDAAAKMGYYKLQDAIKYVKDYLVKNAGQDKANQFSENFLTKAYSEYRLLPGKTAVQRPPTEEQLSRKQTEQTTQQSAFEKDAQEKAAAEAQRQADLQEVAGKYIPQTKVDAEIREEYELSRQALKEKNIDVPAWEDLKADEKDKYLGVLKNKNRSAKDYDNAARILSDYIKQKGGTDEGISMSAGERRVVNGYEENRVGFQRLLNINFPSFFDLSPEAQNLYFNNVKNNTGVEQNAGFTAVAEQLEKEGKGIRGVTRAGIEQLKTRQTSEKTAAAAQERIAKERKEASEAVGKGEPISEETRTKLENGDINGVLKDLTEKANGLKTLKLEKGDRTYRQAYAYLANARKRTTQIIFRNIADALNGINFKSKVVTDKNNEIIQRLEREGKLAEYDPKTDTFYFTDKGFDEATVLHEIIHAGTVKLISKFLTDPMNTKRELLPHQHQALQHMADIYQFAKKRLGGRFPNAFENMYEFISYALTDNKFQMALADTQARSLAKYTVKTSIVPIKTLWDNLTKAFSKLYSLTTARSKVGKLPAEIYQQVAKESASMDPDELYKNNVLELNEELELELVKGKEPEIKKKTRKTLQQGDKFLTNIPGYEGNLLLEISEIFNDILEAPEAGIDVAPLAAKPPQGKKQAPFLKVTNVYDANTSFAVPAALQKKTKIEVLKNTFSNKNIVKLATIIQNASYPIRRLEKQIQRAGATVFFGPNVNIFNTIQTLASGKAMSTYSSKVQEPHQRLQQSLVELSKTKEIIDATEKINIEREKIGESKLTPLENLQGIMHIYGQAFTDVERRLNKFVQTAPLDNTNKNIPVGNKMMTLAEIRELVLGNPNTNKTGILSSNLNLTKKQARDLWLNLESYIFTKDAAGNKIPNPKYVVPGGYSPTGNTAIDFRTADGNTQYNVTGLTFDETKNILDQYSKDPQKVLYDKAFDDAWRLGEIAFELNKESYYASKPAANWKNAYGYEKYLPLKGLTLHTPMDNRVALNFDGTKLSNELLQSAIKSDGRFTVSKNPILQVMTDAVVASMRAGKGSEYTLSIKNLIKDGWIKGKVAETISFADRSEDKIKSVQKVNTIFHHNEDGSIDVLEIDPKDRAILESIRKPLRNNGWFIQTANNITGLLGQSHTRYNVNFAPMNFTRDALTNALNIGAEFGPVEGAKILNAIAEQVGGRNSLGKAFKMARAYKTPKFDSFKNSTDPIERAMYEYVTEGGMVEYMESISLKSNMEKLNQELGRNKILKTKDQIDKAIDVWTNMFELASRSATYSVLKQKFINDGMDANSAKIRAAAYVKNLANFEQVGEMGKTFGAFYMYFRASATGAVRAVEPLLTALPDIGGMGLTGALNSAPEKIKNDPALRAEFVKNFKAERKAARWQSLLLLAMGAMAYSMSYMFADDDEEGRNKVLTDDMGQWARYWRIHVPGYDQPLQIPWGFGQGAFLASGAQLAAWFAGQQSFGDVMKNGITQIALDSFVPLPISRMDITDTPLAWFVDTISPSVIRPAVEFVANKNGLGQSIYNDASGRKMGDAYLGGDHVPETYKEGAIEIAKLTDRVFGNPINISPNVIYFFVNSYADGIGKLMDYTVNAYYYATGGTDFNPKTGIPFIGSFIGSPPSIDSREFNLIENKVAKMRQNINQFKNDPNYYDEFLDRHPDDVYYVKIYDKNIGNINKYRHEATKIRGSKEYSIKEKQELLKENLYMQNYLKHRLVEIYKEEGIKP
jgi:Large polyvalent protein associated domain 38